MNEELNKKLIDFAGMFVNNLDDDHWIGLYEDKVFHLEPFTESLDACFEWLVPKAIDRIMAEQECSSDLAYAVLFKKWLQELELDIPQHALTLCKTIEQLIDRGE